MKMKGLLVLIVAIGSFFAFTQVVETQPLDGNPEIIGISSIDHVMEDEQSEIIITVRNNGPASLVTVRPSIDAGSITPVQKSEGIGQGEIRDFTFYLNPYVPEGSDKQYLKMTVKACSGLNCEEKMFTGTAYAAAEPPLAICAPLIGAMLLGIAIAKTSGDRKN